MDAEIIITYDIKDNDITKNLDEAIRKINGDLNEVMLDVMVSDYNGTSGPITENRYGLVLSAIDNIAKTKTKKKARFKVAKNTDEEYVVDADLTLDPQDLTPDQLRKSILEISRENDKSIMELFKRLKS